MCTTKLYGHTTDTALSVDTRTNTKYWKVWQLTDSGYQHLQHHRLIPDRFLTFWRRNNFLNFSTPCIQNVNNTGTKYVRIMKQTAF